MLIFDSITKKSPNKNVAISKEIIEDAYTLIEYLNITNYKILKEVYVLDILKIDIS